MQVDNQAHEEGRRAFWSFRIICEDKGEINYFLEANICFYPKITKILFKRQNVSYQN